MSKLAVGAAGIGVVLLAAAGCGDDTRTAAPQGSDDVVSELVDVTGQQVCDLLSPATLAKHVPEAETANSTVSSTESAKKAMCDSKGLTESANRYLTIDVQTALPTTPGGPAPGVTPDEYAEDWLADARADARVRHEQGKVNGITQDAPEELTGAGADGFTTFSRDEDGATDARGYFRSGPWSVEIDYHGYDRPDPDDRDTKRHLPKDVLLAAIAEIAAEVDGNLPALAGGPGEPEPGDLTGDDLCAMLPDELIDRYLPEAETDARSSAVGGGLAARCSWRSSTPRPDSPGLRLRDGSAALTVWDVDPKDIHDRDRAHARKQHDDGPVKEGPRKGVTYTAPVDVPGLGLAAWTRLAHSPADSPGTSVQVHVLLPGHRTVVVTYSGSDVAELDTGTPGQGDLGTSTAVPDDEVVEAVQAMVKEILAQLG